MLQLRQNSRHSTASFVLVQQGLCSAAPRCRAVISRPLARLGQLLTESIRGVNSGVYAFHDEV
jgi:hypothetical protein